jgi:hypothetical protein
MDLLKPHPYLPDYHVLCGTNDELLIGSDTFRGTPTSEDTEDEKTKADCQH